MILEICASNFQSASNAQFAGANRIELCSELAIGGITPSYGLVKEVLDKLSIPVFILIRPRSGNFTYSDAEFNIMKHNIKRFKDMGCSGIVSGILNKDHTIDIERTKALIELTKPLPFTFHRAFDWTPDPINTMEQLINLGANRILTSGQGSSGEENINLLVELKSKSSNRIIILACGGVNSTNTKTFKKNGFDEIHASASIINHVIEEPKVKMNSEKHFDETIEVISSIDNIKQILKVIDSKI